MARYTEEMEILVVEDEIAIREVEVAYLRKRGYVVSEYADGISALEAFRSYGGDLAVIDLSLPGMDGFELCRRIRENSTIPIIIVTARDGDDDELRGLQVGADDYVKKPFNPNVLMARIHGLLRRRSHARIVRGKLVIDPQTMTVTKEGRLVSLTTTQFNILLSLASQPGVVLTRGKLIEQVYDDATDHDIYDRTIDAHIRSLRKIIEDDPTHPAYIQTVIGSGYRFHRVNA
jgi:DNA-binding response OmpR family regulator